MSHQSGSSRIFKSDSIDNSDRTRLFSVQSSNEDNSQTQLKHRSPVTSPSQLQGEIAFGQVSNVQTGQILSNVHPQPIQAPLSPPYRPPMLSSTLDMHLLNERQHIIAWTLSLIIVSLIQYILAPFSILCGELNTWHGIAKIAHNYFSMWAIILSIPVVWQRYYQEQLLDFSRDYKLRPEFSIFLQSNVFFTATNRMYCYVIIQGVFGDLLYCYLILYYDTSFFARTRLSVSSEADLQCSFVHILLAITFCTFYFYHWMSSVLLLIGLHRARQLAISIRREASVPVPNDVAKDLVAEWGDWQPGFNEVQLVGYYIYYKLSSNKWVQRLERVFNVVQDEWKKDDLETRNRSGIPGGAHV